MSENKAIGEGTKTVQAYQRRMLKELNDLKEMAQTDSFVAQLFREEPQFPSAPAELFQSNPTCVMALQTLAGYYPSGFLLICHGQGGYRLASLQRPLSELISGQLIFHDWQDNWTHKEDEFDQLVDHLNQTAFPHFRDGIIGEVVNGGIHIHDIRDFAIENYDYIRPDISSQMRTVSFEGGQVGASILTPEEGARLI